MSFFEVKFVDGKVLTGWRAAPICILFAPVLILTFLAVMCSIVFCKILGKECEWKITDNKN